MVEVTQRKTDWYGPGNMSLSCFPVVRLKFRCLLWKESSDWWRHWCSHLLNLYPVYVFVSGFHTIACRLRSTLWYWLWKGFWKWQNWKELTSIRLECTFTITYICDLSWAIDGAWCLHVGGFSCMLLKNQPLSSHRCLKQLTAGAGTRWNEWGLIKLCFKFHRLCKVWKVWILEPQHSYTLHYEGQCLFDLRHCVHTHVAQQIHSNSQPHALGEEVIPSADDDCLSSTVTEDKGEHCACCRKHPPLFT